MFAPPSPMPAQRAATRGRATPDGAGVGARRHSIENVVTAAPPARRFSLAGLPVFARDAATPLPYGMRAKLALGGIDDPQERDADRLASHVLNMPAPAAAVRDAHEPPAAPQERAAPGQHPALRSGGAPLDRATRQFFEPRFACDLSHVRIHTDARAAQSAHEVGALAYTVGRDVAFAAGQYAPSSPAGRALLAHELAHTMQAGPPALRRQPKPPTKPSPPPPPPKPDFDQIVQEIGPGLGGPYADYETFAKSMDTTATFLGHSIDRGVRSEFLAKLRTAEKKVDAEFTKSGATKPKGYGIGSVGGFRSKSGPHGWGLAIDIDGARNVYLSHENRNDKKLNVGQRKVDAQTEEVYTRIAEFMLNDPLTLPAPAGGPHQSVIPKLITQTGTTLSGAKLSRSERWGEYYDRLNKESEAMKAYFKLMQGGTTAIDAFLKGDWKTTHPQQSAPSPDAVLTQMWEDYAALGGNVPATGPSGVQNFQAPANASPGTRPFSLADPAGGFLSIPREVVVGMGQVLSRWGAVDFGGESGDVMHFDDMDGLGGEIRSATAAAQAKINAAAAPPAAAGSGSAGGSTAGSGAAPAPPMQSPPPTATSATKPPGK